ncbi:MAG: alpha/beta hydrolase [Nannocystaceae bacterium]
MPAPDQPDGPPPGPAPTHEDDFWQLRRPDGVVLYYRRCGPDDAVEPSILILDGIGCSGWAFRKILPRLAERRRVVHLHYRGHGRSPDPPRPWRIGMTDFADDAAAVCEHAGLGPVVVVGFSMGFQVALELYRRHRSRIVGLLSLAGPSGRVLRNFQGTQAFGQALPLIRATARIASDLTLKAWRRLVPHPLARDLSRLLQTNTDRLAAADLEFYTRQLAEMNPELFFSILAEADRHSAADVLRTIEVPTLVVAGARDSFVPLETMRELAFTIPHVHWKVLAEATHALPAEYPEEMTALIQGFVDGVVAPWLQGRGPVDPRLPV